VKRSGLLWAKSGRRAGNVTPAFLYYISSIAQRLERTVLKVTENDKYTLSSIKRSVPHFLNFNRLPFLCFSSFLSSANMSEQRPLGPFKLVTVNTAPERAKRLIGRMVENVKDKYEIIHSANIESKYARPVRTIFAYRRPAIDNVPDVVKEIKPDILVRIIEC
jgi:hypothetical protein